MAFLALSGSALATGTEPPTLCTSSEHVMISGETRDGFASLCAIGTTWRYRFGRPGHITYTFPHTQSPAQANFAWGTMATSPTHGGYDYSFVDQGIRTVIFRYGSFVKSADAAYDQSTGLIRYRDGQIIAALPFITIRHENETGDRYAIHSHVPLLSKVDPMHFPTGFRVPRTFPKRTQTP